MMGVEINYHLGCENYKRSASTNAHNCHKPKAFRSRYGEFQVEVP